MKDGLGAVTHEMTLEGPGGFLLSKKLPRVTQPPEINVFFLSDGEQLFLSRVQFLFEILLC